jgi:flagellar protein FlaG
MDINAIGGVSQPGTMVRPARADTPPQINSAGAAALLQAETPQPVSSQQAQSRQPVEEAVSSIKAFAQSVQRNLNFSLDESTGRVVVKVTDGDSGELIRQIPSEDALRLAESLDEVRSLLFRAEA